MINRKILLLSVGRINYDCDINFYASFKQVCPDLIHYNYVERVAKIGQKAMNKELLSLVLKEKPYYIFFIVYQNQIDIATLDKIKAAGVRIIAWFSDDYWRFHIHSRNIAEHIFCSITTAKVAIPLYKELGLKYQKSQWGANPDHYKKELSPSFLHDVSFVGQNYGKRKSEIAVLSGQGVSISAFGRGFTGYVDFKRIIEIFNTSKINLNFSSGSFGSGIKHIHGRVFEVCMCGGFLLTEYVDGIEEYFEIGEEIVCFSSLPEAAEKIKYYLKHETERMTIAEAGYIRSLKDHTWVSRIETIFKQADKENQTNKYVPYRKKYEVAFHGDSYLLELVDSVLQNAEIFVETGTYYGHTLEYVARKFNHLSLYSCEPEKVHFMAAAAKVKAYKSRITLRQEASPDFLYSLARKDSDLFKKDVVFWIDAHAFGHSWPLLKEIKFITQNFQKAYIFIDDFKVPGRPGYAYDTANEHDCAWEAINNCMCKNKNYTVCFPDYTQKTSQHHPLTGWVLIEFGHSADYIPSTLKNSVKVVRHPHIPKNEQVAQRARAENILLTTSAAPTQTPFSVTEKRPPIGLGFLISVLKKAGHTVFFIDNYLRPSDFLETEYLQKNSIYYVGIYANTICFRDTLRMLYKLEWLRQTYQWQGKIIVGGPHATVNPDTIPDFVDYIVQGEGEQAILDIVEGKVPERIVRYPRIEELDSIPMPAWEYFVDQPYNWGGTFFTETPVFVVNSSRGCPFRCAFCSVKSIWGRKLTYFSAEKIVSHIEELIKKYGAKGIYFREDNFTISKERLTAFCNLLIEKKIKIPWACESRVSSIDAENIKLMKAAGCCGFYFGVESGSQRILDFVKKDITVAQTKNAFKLCHEYNINAAASIVVGIPTETEQELAQTLTLVKEIKPTVTWYNVFTGIPRSELYEYTLKNNLHRHIDDRGLVYLMDHDKLTKRFYGNNWDSGIPTVTPKISVVMSAYNAEKYIKIAIQSVLRQTYQDFEFIIINDGSTDNTLSVVKEFKDRRIKIVENAENIGLTSSLNNGIAIAKGEYIARMDADDVSLPLRFETQIKFLSRNPDYALIGSSFYQIDETGEIVSFTKVLTENSEINSNLIHQNWFGHGSVMMRKTAFVECGGYSSNFKYAQDYDLWLRISEKFKVANNEEPLYSWRMLKDSISTGKKEEQRKYADLAVSNARTRNILVSVIIPTYNRPGMLRIAIKSVLAQTHQNFEIIIVNDAGEEVKQIIKDCGIEHRVTYIKHIQNKGLAASRNSGLAVATGKYITFLDDDDVFYPEHLKTLLLFLETHKYRVAYTDANRADQVLSPQGIYETSNTVLYMSVDFSREYLLKHNISPVHCFMVEKAILENFRFDEELSAHEDWDFWIRLSRHHDFFHIKNITVEYRHRTEGFVQLSHATNPKFSQTGKTVSGRYRNEPLSWEEKKLPSVIPVPILSTAEEKRRRQGRVKVHKNKKIVRKPMW